MKRVILEVSDTGDVYGPDNWYIGSLQGNDGHFGEAVDAESDDDKFRRIMKLKDAGFSADDIIQMRKAQVL